jgi:hypothetical protein
MPQRAPACRSVSRSVERPISVFALRQKLRLQIGLVFTRRSSLAEVIDQCADVIDQCADVIDLRFVNDDQLRH